MRPAVVEKKQCELILKPQVAPTSSSYMPSRDVELPDASASCYTPCLLSVSASQCQVLCQVLSLFVEADTGVSIVMLSTQLTQLLHSQG